MMTSERAEALREVETLTGLFEWMRACPNDENGVAVDEDWDDLPQEFGGVMPNMPGEVIWAWDERHVIIGRCRDELAMVPRK